MTSGPPPYILLCITEPPIPKKYFLTYPSLTAFFLPHFLTPKSPFFPIISLPSTGPSASPGYPDPPSSPHSSTDIQHPPTVTNQIHTYRHTHTCTSGFGDTWVGAAPFRNPVEKILGAEKEDKCKKNSGHMVALIKSDKVL